MEIMSHNAVLNHLIRKNYEPYDLFLCSKNLLILSEGTLTLSCDDSIIDRHCDACSKREFIGRRRLLLPYKKK